MYEAAPWPVREDLSNAHAAWLDHVASPGTWWDGGQRVAFVEALWEALDDTDPPPPWAATPAPASSPLPATAHAVAARLARHAATTSEEWYRDVLTDLGEGPPAFVELVALAATGCAVGTFGPALGLRRPRVPSPRPGTPSRTAPHLVDATMNWVPVSSPADEQPAVVQALTAVPAEWAMLWRLAGAQYMSLADMEHLDWQRPGSPLQRRHLELVAARLSIVRQCFY